MSGGVSRVSPPEITIPIGSGSRRSFGFFLAPIMTLAPVMVGPKRARRQRERFATGARVTSKAGIEPPEVERRISSSGASPRVGANSLRERGL
jgi:hypothetical protein